MMEDITLIHHTPAASNKLAEQFADYVLFQSSLLDENCGVDESEINCWQLSIQRAISGGDLSTAIWFLARVLDEKQGIRWHIIPEFQKHEVLIRDARKYTRQKPAVEPFQVMAVNYVRAARALFRTAESPVDSRTRLESEQYLLIILNDFFLQTVSLTNSELVHELFRRVNSIVIENIAYVLNISLEDAKKRLETAKEFVNLEDPSKHIVTITSLQKNEHETVTSFQADYCLSELTPELVTEYQQRSDKQWFKILPPWQQNLVNHYVPHILEQNRVLPTQLRTILIGLRNSYQAVYGILDFKSNTYVITANVLHSGTIVYLGKNKEENLRIGKLHGEQLKRFSRSDKVLSVTLNTDINPTGNDKQIVAMSNQILQAMQCYHANLPLNYARRFTPNIYEGINEILKLVATAFVARIAQIEQAISPNFNENQAFYLKIIDYLKGDSKPSGEQAFLNEVRKALQAIIITFPERITDDATIKFVKDSKEIIELSITIRFLSNNNGSLSDADNRNLILACLINFLVFRLSNITSLTVHAACESGKDRTGLLMFRTALISISRLFLKDSLSDAAIEALNSFTQDNTIKLANAGHQQFLAGIQGGTTGAFGIKKDSKGAVPEHEFPKEAVDALIQETASYNKKIAIHSDPLKANYFPVFYAKLPDVKIAICQVLHIQASKYHSFTTKTNGISTIQRFSLATRSSLSLSSHAAHLIKVIGLIEKTKSIDEVKDELQKAAELLQRIEYSAVHGLPDSMQLLQQIKKDLEVMQMLSEPTTQFHTI